MVTSSSTNYYAFFFQVSQVLQGPFTNRNVINSIFYLVTCGNWIKTGYIFPSKVEVSKFAALS